MKRPNEGPIKGPFFIDKSLLSDKGLYKCKETLYNVTVLHKRQWLLPTKWVKITCGRKNPRWLLTTITPRVLLPLWKASSVTMVAGRWWVSSLASFPTLSLANSFSVSSEVTIMFNDKAEKLNGRAAMIGFVAAVGSYLATGQVIPGIWWLTMVPFCFTITSIAFFVLLAYSVEQLSETY